jgi:hypothetical protein
MDPEMKFREVEKEGIEISVKKTPGQSLGSGLTLTATCEIF